jgi:hypothetical protein
VAQVMMVANVQVSRKSVKTAERPKLLSLLAIIKEANELPRMDLPPGGASPPPDSYHPSIDSPFRALSVQPNRAFHFSLRVLQLNRMSCGYLCMMNGRHDV